MSAMLKVMRRDRHLADRQSDTLANHSAGLVVDLKKFRKSQKIYTIPSRSFAGGFALAPT